jgi:hypothetical protein
MLVVLVLLIKLNVQLELTNLPQVKQIVLMQMLDTMLVVLVLLIKQNVQLELTNHPLVNPVA